MHTANFPLVFGFFDRIDAMSHAVSVTCIASTNLCSFTHRSRWWLRLFDTCLLDHQPYSFVTLQFETTHISSKKYSNDTHNLSRLSLVLHRRSGSAATSTDILYGQCNKTSTTSTTYTNTYRLYVAKLPTCCSEHIRHVTKHRPVETDASDFGVAKHPRP